MICLLPHATMRLRRMGMQIEGMVITSITMGMTILTRMPTIIITRPKRHAAASSVR